MLSLADVLNSVNREAILNTRDKYEGEEEGRGKEEIGDKKKELNNCLRSTLGHPFMGKPVSTHS